MQSSETNTLEIATVTVNLALQAAGFAAALRGEPFMSRIFTALAAAGAFLLASAMPAHADDCNARASSAWEPGNGQTYAIEALTDGATCDQAVAAYVVRGADGAPLYYDIYQANQIMVLAGQPTKADMEGALFQWAMQDAGPDGVMHTGSLPEWKAGAETPEAGDFAFYPDMAVDQAYYEQLRAAKAPMICYIQGMESSACLALYEGGFVLVGVQTFPG